MWSIIRECNHFTMQFNSQVSESLIRTDMAAAIRTADITAAINYSSCGELIS